MLQKRKILVFFSLAILEICVLAKGISQLLAKPSGTNEGRIAGSVVDARTNMPLADANIFVEGTVYGTVTTANGRFALELKPGHYTLGAQILGYRYTTAEIQVVADQTTQVDLRAAPAAINLSPIVVTGTRSEKLYRDAPVSTQVITRERIEMSGLSDLRDLLQEETGLNIIQDHGQGVQVQGFDPEYTLILVDGSPAIGRVAGTLDLTRFAVANIERVEIVKGPNSSLYGSEALAGVINIITREPQQSLALNFSGKYGGFDSYDASASVEIRKERIGGLASYNGKGRNHFDLNEATVSWSGPDFTDHTFSGNFFWEINEANKFRLNSRLFIEDQFLIFGVQDKAAVIPLEGNTNIIDWNLSPVLESQLSSNIRFTGKGYLSRYLNDDALTYQANGSPYSRSHFDQYYRQAEAQFDFIFSKRHLLKIGGGGIFESVEADRIAGGEKSNHTFFGFFQHEWLPRPQLDVIASARLDAHSDYGTAFSPKLALMGKLGDNYRIRASFGSGFKAPNFSQLYLDFTNPVIGYSVFGATGATESLNELIERGEIQEVFIDPKSIKDIDAESSIAFNFSVEATPFNFLRLRANLFRNDVKDLIDVQAIAKKTNNQSVFTYFNFKRVFTQGVEAETSFKLGSRWKFDFGYQYVIAKDKDIIEQLENGEIFKTGSNGRIRPVVPGEYGGLFNRSRNSGTLKLSYRQDNGFVVNLRTILRGKYGLFDLNGNGILDDQGEYADPYALVNLNVSVPLTGRIVVSGGLENAFDYVDGQSFAGAPGRIIYAKVNWKWQK